MGDLAALARRLHGPGEWALDHGSRRLTGGETATSRPLRAVVGSSDATISARLLVRAGKGGFGSNLRAAGKQRIVDNFDACRDLEGRRIRARTAEAALRAWEAEAPQRALERVAERYAVEAARREVREEREAAVQLDTSDFRKEARDAARAVREAVRKSTQGRSELKGAGPAPKRAKVAALEDAWGSSDEEEEEEESEGEENAGEDEKHDDDENEQQESPEGQEVKSEGEEPHKGAEQLVEEEKEGEEEEETSLEGEEKPGDEAKRVEAKPSKGGNAPLAAVEAAPPAADAAGRTAEPTAANATSSTTPAVEPPPELRATEAVSPTVASSAGGHSTLPLPATSAAPSSLSPSAPPSLTDAFIGTLSSAADLAAFGPEAIKAALAERGLKMGGTPEQRAERLFLLKDTPLEKLDRKHFAKPKKA